jgi:alpha-L-fucosidase
MEGRLKALALLCLIGFMSGCKSQQEQKKEEIAALPETGNEENLKWFREAKFGMFIHWGPYSMLAGEYKGKFEKEENGEWIMKYMKIPVKEYRDLAHNFNPVKFDAKAWVKLAKSTGMKYIVITAKHHDGFAMYKSAVTDYNITDWTPFKRDPLKELSEACREEGIKLCVYYSHREDWDNPGGYGNDWDYENDWGDELYNEQKFRKYLDEKAKPQLKELLTNYGPIGLVWFDRGMYNREQGLEFVKLVKDLQPECLINSRVGNYSQDLLGDYQSMSDNGMPPGGLGEYWESPQTLNNTWGFRKDDTAWKTPENVIQRLVEIVSRGGNYLLNIGPTGEGEVPAATIGIFQKVGPWVQRNAEAIYGTTANPFPEMPWGYATIKGNNVYLFVRTWPENGMIDLKGLKNQVKSAFFLVNKTENLPVEQKEGTTRIKVPGKAPDNPVTVIALELDGSPKVEPRFAKQNENGSIELNYLTVTTKGQTRTRFNRKGNFHISKWTGPDDSASWDIEIDKPGTFRVKITYSANAEWKDKPYEITTGSESIKAAVVYTGGLFDYQTMPVGYVKFPGKGRHTLSIRPLSSENSYLMYLRSITLEPVSDIKQQGWSAAN